MSQTPFYFQVSEIINPEVVEDFLEYADGFNSKQLEETDNPIAWIKDQDNQWSDSVYTSHQDGVHQVYLVDTLESGEREIYGWRIIDNDYNYEVNFEGIITSDSLRDMLEPDNFASEVMGYMEHRMQHVL